MRCGEFHRSTSIPEAQMEAMRSEAVAGLNLRQKGDYWKCLPNFGHPVRHKATNMRQGNMKNDNELIGTVPEITCPGEDDAIGKSLPKGSAGNNPWNNPTKNVRPAKSRKYHRVFSEPLAGFKHLGGSPAGLKRTTSVTEIRTRLLCPKGLLIATEPPKSGDTYRRRANTDVAATKAMASLKVTDRKKNYTLNEDSSPMNNSDQFDDISQKEKESILLELESVKYERYLLQKENKRLREELDNRNKVIDHLTDYLKSNVSSDEAGPLFGDHYSDAVKTPPSDSSKMNSFV